MITEYGYDVFFPLAAICLLAIVGAFLLVNVPILKYSIVLIALLILLFAINFFRDPERIIPTGENLVLAPADGKIIDIRDVVETEYLAGSASQISIFMSPVNVHVNRIPISGKVAYQRYIPGEFFAAFEEKASLKNEQTHIGLESGKSKVLFKQIAGFIARRIVCNLKVGDSVRQGDRFGMIKFGSRVDVFLPKGATIRVKLNETTVAGETILADFISSK